MAESGKLLWPSRSSSTGGEPTDTETARAAVAVARAGLRPCTTPAIGRSRTRASLTRAHRPSRPVTPFPSVRRLPAAPHGHRDPGRRTGRDATHSARRGRGKVAASDHTDETPLLLDEEQGAAWRRRVEEKTEDKGYTRQELRYGSFSRTLPLPEGASESNIKATYKDGILEIRVPVSEPPAAAAPTRVAVTRLIGRGRVGRARLVRQRPTLRPPLEGLREGDDGEGRRRPGRSRLATAPSPWLAPVLDGLSFREHAVGWGTGTGLLGRRELLSARRDRRCRRARRLRRDERKLTARERCSCARSMRWCLGEAHRG